jgi:hypothetical protein
MNDFDDLDELERTFGRSLQVALRRAADEITDVPYLGAGPSPDLPHHRRRWLVPAVAAAVLVVAGGILVRVATDDSSPVVIGGDLSTVPTTDPAPPSSERPSAVAPAGARPSTPPAGTLLAGLPNRPLFV